MTNILNQQLGLVHISTGIASTPVPIMAGQAVYILGRNGTGKSALVHNIVGQLPRSVYIPGSRPSYFDNDSLQMTPAARRQMEGNWSSWDRQPYTRYRPINGTQRNEKAILDLQSAETQFKVDAASEIKELGASAGAVNRLQSSQSPFDRVNGILRQANLPIQIVMTGAEMMARQDGAPYSIARMSDGERAALIISSDVISAPSHTIFLIDEPELHLHRSIVVPLLATLMRERPDCAFMISTHELELPSQGANGIVVLVRGCIWNGETVSGWNVDIIPAIQQIPEELRVDLIGSRQRILFVEGQNTSLDQPFYAMLYPAASVRAKETSRDVRQAVKSLRAIEGLHHAKAYGLIDNDALSQEFVKKLETEGVYALPIASIESLYYSQDCVASVATFQANNLGIDASDLVAAARAAALQSLSDPSRRAHLAGYVAELKMRGLFKAAIPDKSQMTAAESDPLTVSINSPYQSELNRLDRFVATDDLESIIAKYPVRESPMLNAIAAALRFRDRGDYERAVLARLVSDSTLRQGLRAKLSSLTDVLG